MIASEPLHEAHFPLLLEWLTSPHVKKWWVPGIPWTEELVRKCYESYMLGYKVVHLQEGKALKKPVHAFIINFEENQ